MCWPLFLLLLVHNTSFKLDTDNQKLPKNILVTFKKEQNVKWTKKDLLNTFNASFTHPEYMIVNMQRWFLALYDQSFRSLANNSNLKYIKKRENLKYFFIILEKYIGIASQQFEYLGKNNDRKLVYKKLTNQYNKMIKTNVDFTTIPAEDNIDKLLYELQFKKSEKLVEVISSDLNVIEVVNNFIDILYEFYLKEKSYLTEYLNFFSVFEEHYIILQNYGEKMIKDTKQNFTVPQDASYLGFTDFHIVNPSFYVIKSKQNDSIMYNFDQLFKNIKNSSYKKFIIHFHITEKNINNDKQNEYKISTDDNILLKNFFNIILTNLDEKSSIQFYITFDATVKETLHKISKASKNAKKEFKEKNP